MKRRGTALTLWAVGAAAMMAVSPAAGAQNADRPVHTPEERAAALARPAVVYVETHWKGWVRDQRDGLLWLQEASTFTTGCTGFVVNPSGYVVTAGHCVDDGVEGIAPSFFEDVIATYEANGWEVPTYEELVDHSIVEGESAGTPPEREVYVQRGTATSGLTTGEAFGGRIVDFDTTSAGDVALLKVDEPDMSSVLLAPSSEIEIGTPILAVGYPASAEAVSDATFEPTNKDGKVSAKRTSGGVPFYEISAATTGGMSGGPVVDMDGRVVGLVSFGPAGESQAFNFIAPSSLIAEMLAKNGVTNQIGRIDRLYRHGLDRYLADEYTAAVQGFDAVLDLAPAHQQAQEFRTRAVERRARFGESAGIPPWGIGLAVATFVLGAVGAAFAFGQRRGRTSGGTTPNQPAPPELEIRSVEHVEQRTASAPESAPVMAVPATTPARATADGHRRQHGVSPTSARCSSCGAALRWDSTYCVSCGRLTDAGEGPGST